MKEENRIKVENKQSEELAVQVKMSPDDKINEDIQANNLDKLTNNLSKLRIKREPTEDDEERPASRQDDSDANKGDNSNKNDATSSDLSAACNDFRKLKIENQVQSKEESPDTGLQHRGPNGGTGRDHIFAQKAYNGLLSSEYSVQKSGGKRGVEDSENVDPYYKFYRPVNNGQFQQNDQNFNIFKGSMNKFPEYQDAASEYRSQSRDMTNGGKMVVKSSSMDMSQSEFTSNEDVVDNLLNGSYNLPQTYPTANLSSASIYTSGTGQMLMQQTHQMRQGMHQQYPMNHQQPMAVYPNSSVNSRMAEQTNLNLYQQSQNQMVDLTTINFTQPHQTRNEHSESETECEKSPFSEQMDSPGSSKSINSPPPSNMSGDSGIVGDLTVGSPSSNLSPMNDTGTVTSNRCQWEDQSKSVHSPNMQMSGSPILQSVASPVQPHQTSPLMHPVPSPQQIMTAPSPSHSMGVPSPQQAMVAPSPQAMMAPSPQQAMMAPSPQQAMMVPSPQQAMMAPSPQQAMMAPSPQQAMMAPSPQQAMMVPSPQQAMMAPSPQQAMMAPSPQQARMVPSPQQMMPSSQQQIMTAPSPSQIANTSTTATHKENFQHKYVEENLEILGEVLEVIGSDLAEGTQRKKADNHNSNLMESSYGNVSKMPMNSQFQQPTFVPQNVQPMNINQIQGPIKSVQPPVKMALPNVSQNVQMQAVKPNTNRVAPIQPLQTQPVVFMSQPNPVNTTQSIGTIPAQLQNPMPIIMVPPTTMSAQPVVTGPGQPNTIIIVAPQSQQMQTPQKSKTIRKILPKLPSGTDMNKGSTLNNTSITAPKVSPTVRNINEKPAMTQPIRTQNGAPRGVPNTQAQERQHLLNLARRTVANISREQLQFTDREGDTYLHIAVCKTDSCMVQALLERLKREKLDNMIDMENKKRQTPLYLAVVANQPQMVTMFIKCGADPSAMAQVKSTDGKSTEVKAPIHVASSNGESYRLTLNELLKAKDINLNIVNSEGHTALHCAILSHRRQTAKGELINSLSIIEMLIQKGVEPNSQDKKSGKTPLMYAIEKQDPSLVERMLCLFEPSKLRNIIKSQTFDGSSCLKIAEGHKSSYQPEIWQKLYNMLNAASNGDPPRLMLVNRS